MTVEYLTKQWHAGISSMDGDTLWHTDSKGLYWCGHWHHRTPLQLLNECETTIQDLLKDYPGLHSSKQSERDKVLDDPCEACHYQTQSCGYILDGSKIEDACSAKRIQLRSSKQDGEP